ncbi:transcriptional regulator [Vagococcus sp. DIV0080]|uniref:Transcriptional regulator n=1 Tax=Candidatus Vagococcus giribetii TaxID=2230876 RepID=A0ABS3HSR7_9ENTE|nr:YerC/YecD family TrpR-related protein [Vagococcus sp. DIV0080]MBO0476696.1 transcriptional regulator [Vagococcus sp. DIV0080]
MRIDKLSKEETKHFFDAVLALENVDECYGFFDDLMTLKEMKVFVTRLTVAEMLLEGKTYQEIEKRTQASTAIISRVKRSIEEGNGSYEMLRERVMNDK